MIGDRLQLSYTENEDDSRESNTEGIENHDYQ